jgi:hypothetical protein
MSFLTAGDGGAFRLAGSCPVAEQVMHTDYAAHHGIPSEPESYMVADMITRDGTAAVRVVLWRCQYCATLLIGVGRTDEALDGPPGTGFYSQDFTWLEADSGVRIGLEEPPEELPRAT